MVKGLVLAGGGAKGSYQVGVYQALQELGWHPDIITGASVGSLNAALFALGKGAEAAQLWKTLDVHGVLEVPQGKTPEEIRSFLLGVLRGGGLDLQPLGDTIDEHLNEDALRASPIKYGLVLTEMGNMRSHQCPIDQIPHGKLKEYMMGSSACFPALRPREIDGVKYIDGGWRDNMPLDLAKAMGAQELIGVDVDGIGYTKPNTTGLPTRIIRSHWDLGPLFEFDGARAAKNIALGYQDTMRLFGRVGGTAYAILPAQDGFAAAFAETYQQILQQAAKRMPTVLLTERAARLAKKYPAPFEANLTAPTAAALAPLELAAELADVPPEQPATARVLALTMLGSITKDPAERFPLLLDADSVQSAVGEAALAAAEPESFVAALVAKTLEQMGSKLFG